MRINTELLLKKIIEEKEQLGIKRKNFADEAGVSVATIYAIEKGKNNPSLDLFVTMANNLGYDVVLKKREIEQDKVKKLDLIHKIGQNIHID